MTTASRLLLCALAACAPAWALVRAQDRPVPRNTGRVLLLQNEGILEGVIERHGDEFRVRRASGELWVGAERVLCLCADWEEAFAIFSRQANLHDADERVRLARWCDHNGLREHALAEVAAALKLRPDHAAAKLLLARLRNSAARPATPAVAKPPEAADGPVPAVDLSAESLALFTSRVQPILMNACANCHAAERGGKFKLVRCYDPTVNRRGLHQNLAAVLMQIDLDEPALSPLLYKSISGHGDSSKAPIPGRRSVPYATLQDWVEMVIANNPHLRKELGRPKKAAAGAVFGAAPANPRQRADTESTPLPPEARPVSQQPTPLPGSPVFGTGPAPTVGVPALVRPPAPVISPASGASQPPAFGVDQAAAQGVNPATTQSGPCDPYDASIFNTQYARPK